MVKYGKPVRGGAIGTMEIGSAGQEGMKVARPAGDEPSFNLRDLPGANEQFRLLLMPLEKLSQNLTKVAEFYLYSGLACA